MGHQGPPPRAGPRPGAETLSCRRYVHIDTLTPLHRACAQVPQAREEDEPGLNVIQLG